MSKTPYLDKPGRGKGPNGAKTIKPSIMDRIVERRRKGPRVVAQYVFTRRSQILNHLRLDPGRLSHTEWAILERLIREAEERANVRQNNVDRKGVQQSVILMALSDERHHGSDPRKRNERMTNPDYPAFRRYLDACVDGHESAATVVECAEGPNIYILPQALYAQLKDKAEAYDREHGIEQSQKDASEEVALRELFEDRQD